jgi:hypothetical protein
MLNKKLLNSYYSQGVLLKAQRFILLKRLKLKKRLNLREFLRV